MSDLENRWFKGRSGQPSNISHKVICKREEVWTSIKHGDGDFGST